jgi:iron(III) transport system substrate-binding protein
VQRPRRLRLTALSIASLALVLGSCGDDDDATSDTEAAADTAAAEPTDTAAAATTEPAAETTAAESTTAESTEPTDTADGTATTAASGESSAEADAALESLVAAAQEEGGVTIYSSQGLDQLNALGQAFEEEYGIPVEVVRNADADIIARLDTEFATNTSGGDLVVLAAQLYMETHAESGDWVDPTASPQLAGLGAYDTDQYMHDGNIFEVGAAVLTFGWNTDLVPDGLTDYPDLLDPSLAGGKIGVPDPAISPVLVDFYLWLEESFGEEFVTSLAAQEPRIYPSSLPMGEALQSGEIYAGAFVAPVQLVPAQEAAAPVDFGISEDAGAWGARYFGGIPRTSDSPNAAALLADFMVTPEGQELVQGASGSVLPDIPGTLITNDRMRETDLEATTPENAAAYVEDWNALFR